MEQRPFWFGCVPGSPVKLSPTSAQFAVVVWSECDLHVSRSKIYTTRETVAGTITDPLTFLIAFHVDIVLNPNNWTGPLYLVPNILFVGGGLLACRIDQTTPCQESECNSNSLPLDHSR